MEKMVYDLLNLSKLQNSKMEVHYEEVDLNQLVNEMLKLYSPQFTENHIAFKYEQIDIKPVMTDRIKLVQIMSNYINNALTHVNEQKQITITVKERENTYQISVFNSGEMIPESEIESIWESFYRADLARNRTNGNVGLGLSIVKELAIMIQANVGVENEGDGVSFWIELPKMTSIN